MLHSFSSNFSNNNFIAITVCFDLACYDVAGVAIRMPGFAAIQVIGVQALMMIICTSVKSD